MPMRNFNFLATALLCLALISMCTAADTKHGTLARILAKRTGATQFVEERYDTHTNCDEHKHHLKKRASDEDVDYEVYQGVVGRPGIDFPIFPRIPKTSFSCRTYGNGYFADMETDCQVFHICEEGRKISFLCPNGTIFQQNELTCDWWFKVNCLDSSSYYGDSAEILGAQRAQRVRPRVPVQGFNIVGGGLNIKPKVTPVQPRGRNNGNSKPDRRIDSNEAVESLDFDDISSEKKRKQPIANIDNNSNDQESQITAESASFVGNNGGDDGVKRPNNYNEQDVPKVLEGQQRQKQQKSPTVAARRGVQRLGNNESTERARNGHRGQQRYRDSNGKSSENSKPVASSDSYERTSSASVEVSSEVKKPREKKPIETEKPEIYQAHSTRAVEKIQITTPQYSTYSTARRFESTRSTPYYTPTVPALSKSKATEGKTNYIKGHGNSGSFAMPTPNPNRFTSAAGTGVFFESSAAPKPTASAIDANNASIKPIVIGMRHYTDGDLISGEKKVPSKNSVFQDYLPTTTPATTGPTYLPKSAAVPKALPGAAGDALLFAPNPVKDESITRNVEGMLKTMNLLKNKFDDVDIISKPSSSRAGLEIPPSSGPDALISLAKYFAQEHNESSPNSLDSDAPVKTKLSVNPPKPSDTTAILTTSDAPPNISDDADDIKTSLLSEKTKNQYSNLFGLKAVKAKELSDGLLSHANATAPTPVKDNYNPFPAIGSTGATISALAEVPESRKIAKVFSSALNTYLDNPENFRASLAAVRPTEPPTLGQDDSTTAVSVSQADFSDGTAKYYLPTKSTFDFTTPTPANIAAEINQNFDFTTTATDYSSTTFESNDSGTTYRASLELSAELAPLTPDSGEGDEFLQHEQTQSFVKSRNELVAQRQKENGKPEKLTDANDKPTEHPWTLKSQTDFLDPLTINDGLMKEPRTTTASAFTYLPQETTTLRTATSTNHARISSEWRLLSDAGHRGRAQDASSNAYDWEDIFSTYDIPRDALPSNSGLQRIANKLFGGLNEQEALHLKSVMAHAEHNRQVLSLLLLLIQTCDDNNGKALERSRKHLLNALIGIDGKLQRQQQTGKLSHQKEAASPLTTTTARLPVTTFRNGAEDYTSTTPGTTTTDLPLSTTTALYDETTKFEIRVADPEEDLTASATQTPTAAASTAPNANSNSDRRALELLKSLYSLASKFNSRR